MGKARPEAEGLDVFSKLLLDSTLAHNLSGMDDNALAHFAFAAFAHLIRKPHKRHAIGFRTTDLAANSGTVAPAQPACVLEILDDDMPFLVESIVATLHARGLRPRLVFHPIFKVKRYGSGRLQAVVGGGDRHWAGGDQESYFAAVLDPLDDAARTALTADLDIVLDDVRQAANDGDAMRRRVAQAITAYEGLNLGVTAMPGAADPMEVREAIDFLRWLKPENFTLLGVRDFEFVGMDERADLWPSASGALGVAKRQEATPPQASAAQAAPSQAGEDKLPMTPAIRAVYASSQPLIFSKTQQPGNVRRRAPLDRIGIKRYTQAGKLIGETRLYGLFTPASYLQPVEAMPVVRLKVRQVLGAAQFPPDSHNGRTLIDILENFPRDELLQIDAQRLLSWSHRLLDFDISPRTGILMRRDDIGRWTSVLAFVPRDHYTSAIRERIGRFLEEQLGGAVTAFYPYIGSGPMVRTRLILADGAQPATMIDEALLEAGIVDIVTTWEDKLAAALSRHLEPTRAAVTTSAFSKAFSAGYEETFGVERAVEDIARIERLGPDRPAAIDLYRDPDAPAHRIRAAIYRFDQPIPLSERVPILENLGFRVIDERSYRIRPTIGGQIRSVVLHDMMLETADGASVDLAALDGALEDAFIAVFSGVAENDGFNGLVLNAGLDWRQAAVLRAFAGYMRQIRAPFGPRYIAETLQRYPAVARDLHALLGARLDPLATGAQADPESIRQRIDAAITGVQGLDEDRILRRLLSIVLAVVRTNALSRDGAGQSPAVLGFKFASREIDRLPEPKPYREIFVYSPRVEGIHLRFAAIARGGIRWSDRPQDYRTEVLGLAKAQQVKNTVIVPSGAKGGFVLKQLPRNASRDETQVEAIACYKLFISALLDLTDNIRNAVCVPPPGLKRRDGDDPYLVVAADKGTATFSDYANAISLERGFWLGDAFASGGSAGYDHKQLGITARGAWECVKRHFREMDIDIQKTPFRVVGVGDMSGDVFGNAMLLSGAIRLVAAFDHRHIFIDPDPDPASSIVERKRLFALPRSSWADYDASLISTGGGVYSRDAKSVPLSPATQALLGINGAALAPADLIQAILRCEADLLWFGGIGTFVRESGESDDQAGDRANDALRITAAEVRAKVVGEGANLGFTQRARIEAAIRGVRIDTDFIDNSAGVNTSDQEVNIKIALEPALAAGSLKREDRNRLLSSMSSEVATAVLANNHAQGLALSLAQRAAKRDLDPFIRLIRYLEERGLVERKLEALPSGSDLSARARDGAGLTRPELAVLLSWAKIALNADLVTSTLPDDPAAAARILDYFPSQLRERHRAAIEGHRLRREIIATSLTNSVINRGGPQIIAHFATETGKPPAAIARVFLAANEIHGIDRDWPLVDALDGRVSGVLQLELYEALQDLALRETRWLLLLDSASLADAIDGRRAAALELSADLAGIVPAGQRAAFTSTIAQLTSAGVPADLATRHAGRTVYRATLELTDLARAHGAPLRETARIRLAVLDYLHLDDLRARSAALVPADTFDQQAIDTGLAALTTAESRLISRVLADSNSRGLDIATWVNATVPPIAASRATIDEVLLQPGFSIARLAVAAESLRIASQSGKA